MNATWSTAKAGASPRPAVPLHVDHIDREAVESPFGEAQSNKKRLISHSHDVAGEPHHFGRAPVRMGACPGDGVLLANPGCEHSGGGVMRRRLNAFFAFSVNSPSMSMVNFPCCVCSAPTAGTRGVTRRVTPQPMRAAVRMEAGADACI